MRADVPPAENRLSISLSSFVSMIESIASLRSSDISAISLPSLVASLNLLYTAWIGSDLPRQSKRISSSSCLLRLSNASTESTLKVRV